MPHDPRVLVDYRTHDDAGVYKIDEQTAIVQTVDFFTPIVDDPFRYGQIAAANALSDVYAMGGKPITALAVAAFPSKDVDPRVIGAVFAGGLSMLREAGVALLGGHTVRDQEIKFGYAVTGTVHPDRYLVERGRARRRRAAADEADRHGDRDDGDQVRARAAGVGGCGDRVDVDVESRGGGSARRRSTARSAAARTSPDSV